MTALTVDELMAWVERTSAGWRGLLKEHPEALAIECDIMATGSIAKLLQHIVAVELRYAQRLAGMPESHYEETVFGTTDEIYSTHEQAMKIFRELIVTPEFNWEQPVTFATRSAGTLKASRRTVLVHTLMHSIRHYAQLGTLVRQHGIKPDWPMDYLFMGAQPAS